MASRFAASIILSREEALTVLASLEGAAEVVDAVNAAGDNPPELPDNIDPLSVAFDADGAARMLQDKLTDSW